MFENLMNRTIEKLYSTWGIFKDQYEISFSDLVLDSMMVVKNIYKIGNLACQVPYFVLDDLIGLPSQIRNKVDKLFYYTERPIRAVEELEKKLRIK
jgi:hypothetical protein